MLVAFVRTEMYSIMSLAKFVETTLNVIIGFGSTFSSYISSSSVGNVGFPSIRTKADLLSTPVADSDFISYVYTLFLFAVVST